MSYVIDALYDLELLENQQSKSTIKSCLRVLLVHMLKCKYQPEYQDKKSWRNSIINSFEKIDDQFPKIGKGALYRKFYLKELDLNRIYQQARIKASKETSKPLDVFPKTCEWTKEQLIDYTFINQFVDVYGIDKNYNPNQLEFKF